VPILADENSALTLSGEARLETSRVPIPEAQFADRLSHLGRKGHVNVTGTYKSFDKKVEV